MTQNYDGPDNIPTIIDKLPEQYWLDKFNLAIRQATKPTYLRIGRGKLYDEAGHFFRALLRSSPTRAWKVVVPDFTEPRQGALYYVVHTEGGRTLTYRGTYGYQGSGPHDAALVEYALCSIFNLKPELRTGDYLLSFYQEGRRHDK